MSNIALVSVYDKTGIVEFCNELVNLDFKIISTGGTAKILKQAEIPVCEISEITQFPEILEGRVKTLHPKIFGGILAKRTQQHLSQVTDYNIPLINLVCIQLYPFVESFEKGKQIEELIELIDIGGVALLRAAAKNFQDVVVICDMNDYGFIIEKIKQDGQLDLQTRKNLAAKAFAYTSFYDSIISQAFRHRIEISMILNSEDLFKKFTIPLEKVSKLRYGENPHQKASLYRIPGDKNYGLVNAQQLQGKELSFNNFLDLESAWNLVNDFPNETVCVIIKHNNPCGVGKGNNTLDAYKNALESDPVSAFGGVVGFNGEVDGVTADEITKLFLECIIAPSFTTEALEILKSKKNLRVLKCAKKMVESVQDEIEFKNIVNGMLVQTRDIVTFSELKVVTNRKPNIDELEALKFGWKVAKHVKSNAIVLCNEKQTVGIGGGQTSRIDSLKIALEKFHNYFKIQKSNQVMVMASDGFFPFPDCVQLAAKEAVTAIIQPGGSIRDNESIEEANRHNIAMVFTGFRHFKH